MTRLFSICVTALSIAALFSSCGNGESSSPQGQLVGNKNKATNINSVMPIGMKFVPSGVMRMGLSDQDMRNANDAKMKTVQVLGFYMDATEVTNAEYRQFTDYCRDSMIHGLLDHYKDLDDGSRLIDWKQKIKWNTEDVDAVIENYYIPANQTMSGKREFNNVEKIVYNYDYINFDDLARAKSTADRKQFITKMNVQVYPDTTVWMKMFQQSYNDPITLQYNWHKTFDEYPVVGVNWKQTQAFCNWRTLQWRNYRWSKKKYTEGQFRLPTEAEWEWAARGGRQQSPFPWGGPYVVNKKGCYLANFKPNRGNYGADGGLYTVKAAAYWPNDYGLYNMSGNVAEWTQSAYIPNSYGTVADMNPEVRFKATDNDPLYQKRKVIRGGSWKDVQHYIQVDTRDYEYMDTAKAYIGFRCVLPQIGSALSNKPVKK